MLPADVADLFSADGVYLNTAMYGLPPRSARDAFAAAASDWGAGRVLISAWRPAVDRARAALARLHGVDEAAVTLGSSVSPLVGLVAAGLPSGARVLIPDDEFLSVVLPLRARPEIEVVSLPFQEVLTRAADGDATLVAASLVRSQDGLRRDGAALIAAARAGGAAVLLDVTQAGWLDLRGLDADYLVGAGHKWLLAPHGTAFMVATPAAQDRLVALGSGWTARADDDAPPWGNDQARHPGGVGLEASPAYLVWAAQAASLELIETLGILAISAHDLALAAAFATPLGLPVPDAPIVTVPAEADVVAALGRAGVRATIRAGRVRVSFHLNNRLRDAELAAEAVLSARR